MHAKTNWQNEQSKLNYEAGIQLANGLCHLAISNIPPKILKLANMFGYRGVESIGFKYLYSTAFDLSGIFSEIARLFLLAYWTYVEPHMWGAKHVDMAKQLLDTESQRHPNV